MVYFSAYGDSDSGLAFRLPEFWVQGNHDRERPAVGIRSPVLKLDKQIADARNQLAFCLCVEFKAEPPDSEIIGIHAVDVVEKGLHEDRPLIRHRGRPGQTCCPVGNLSAATTARSTVNCHEQTAVEQGANVVQARAGVEVEFLSDLPITVRLVEAKTQDPHPQRRRKRPRSRLVTSTIEHRLTLAAVD